MKKYILPIVNIVLSLICFIVLFFSKLSDNTVYLMMITMLVGWAIPYFVLLVSGLELISMKHPKMSLVFNVLNVLVCLMDLIFTIRLFDKKMLILLIEYILMGILSLINVVYIVVYLRRNPNLENDMIKKIKDKNNGAIV